MSSITLNQNIDSSLDQALNKAKKLFDDIKYSNPSYETITDRPAAVDRPLLENEVSLNSKKKRDILVEPVLSGDKMYDSTSIENSNNSASKQDVNLESNDQTHDNDATILKTNKTIDINNLDLEECKDVLPNLLSEERKNSLINVKSQNFNYRNGSMKKSNLSLKEKGKINESGYHWPLSPLRSICFFISLLLPIIVSFLFIYALPCPKDKVCIHNCPQNLSAPIVMKNTTSLPILSKSFLSKTFTQNVTSGLNNL